LELKKHASGLEDRWIVVFQSIPEKYKRGLDDLPRWKVSDVISKKLKQSDSKYKIVLLGLDREIKLRKNEVLPCEELFGTIDQMPMRRSEMKKDA
jgi:hypothetical protein